MVVKNTPKTTATTYLQGDGANELGTGDGRQHLPCGARSNGGVVGLEGSDGEHRVVVVGEDPAGRRQHGNTAVLELGLAKPER